MSMNLDSIVPISVDPIPASAPAGWQWVKLANVARLESGHTPSRFRADWWGGDICWLSLTEIRGFDGQWVSSTRLRTNEEGINNSAARVLPKGTVCLSRTASVGFVAILASPMATSQDFANWVCGPEIDPEFLMYSIIRSRDYIRGLASGATHKTIYMPTLEEFKICVPSLSEQKKIVTGLRIALSEAYRAISASRLQAQDASILAHAIVHESIVKTEPTERRLGDLIDEVKQNVGADWASYSVLGATRDGLAPAKELPGKQARRYKPVNAGTVFYNPMRILIGSIALVDDDDVSGITSPDYVVLRGKCGVLDSRWFYHWLRSPFGAQCIQSLARGAVRERMLFNRLADGNILLPSFSDQQRASVALRELKSLSKASAHRFSELQSLPQRIISNSFYI